MLYARLKNKQLEIEAKEQDKYLAKGWTILKSTKTKEGNVKLELVSEPEGNLKEENKKLKQEIAKLKAEIKSLKA